MDGYFWGTTSSGGTYGNGTIFKVRADGSDWQTVHSFWNNGVNSNGGGPNGKLVGDGASSFLGTCAGGGNQSRGTVFKINSTTGALTTLVAFTDVNGAYPGMGSNTISL